MKEKIVFVSHEATLSGAPILLFNILSYLKDKLPYDFIVVLAKDGPTRTKFEQLGEVFVYPEIAPTGVMGKVLRRVKMAERYKSIRIHKLFSDKAIKLIFANTIVNGELVDKINVLQVPVITYVHELEYAIQMQNPGHVQQALRHTALFLAGSQAVQRQLMALGVGSDKVRVMPSSVPVQALASQLASLVMDSVRQELQLAAHNQVLVAVGAAEWRKGNDLFMQMARLVASERPHVHFVWVGVPVGSVEHIRMTYDIKRLHLEKRFHLIPVTPEYLKYIALADIFVLSSREDPFPLVVLEAAVAGKPTVCFADSGGSPEFVGTANGMVVPYANVEALTTSVLHLLDNPAERMAKGEHARAQVQQEHDIPVVANRIAEVMVEYTA